MSELEEQIAVRREKRARLREEGVEVYPARCAFDHEPTAVRQRWGEAAADELEREALRVRVPGRVRARRDQGKVVFLDLSDGRERLQAFVRRQQLDEASAALLERIDLGDYLLAEGPLLRTRTGELSVFAERLTLLSKALRPLPEKWHGLADTEARYRQRYLDLIANPESRATFEIRARLVAGIRRFLDQRGFLEVETPMMQPVPGGAVARPFVTHHNALDLELYLRIAPELYLKRLLVGGLHRVYEINRNFRNEGISTQHNPEFTMLEFYQAYSDYRQLMDLTEELIVGLVDEIHPDKARKLPFRGKVLDFSPPWPRWTMAEALVHLAGVPEADTRDTAGLLRIAQSRGIELGGGPTVGTAAGLAPEEAASRGAAAESGVATRPDPFYGTLLARVFEALCEEHLDGPVFIVDHPVEVSPLAKQKPEDPRFTERFELYLGGMEIANAFSELNDPDLQAERFRAQLAARDAGDEEAHRFDHDYVRALEHGMPPAGGEGIGIDRLTMV
ncbi:MAG TPA: lysine--tRNA ligase, partial [Thermoanaerobaculia bacterium]|nr:lysine--tRNA ligase [Thermoanaerobaculia bacterium]